MINLNKFQTNIIFWLIGIGIVLFFTCACLSSINQPKNFNSVILPMMAELDKKLTEKLNEIDERERKDSSFVVYKNGIMESCLIGGKTR